MKVALDTNVLVSGLLNPHGPPGMIVRLIAVGELRLCYDARILSEYRDVLLRPKFGFHQKEVGRLLEQIREYGELAMPKLLNKPLPDPDDEPFLEVCLGGKASYLITGNMRHFPQNRRMGQAVLGPAEFIEAYRTKVE